MSTASSPLKHTCTNKNAGNVHKCSTSSKSSNELGIICYWEPCRVHHYSLNVYERCCLQDAAGFTALMRLLQRGMWSDARQLLAAGDCSLNAQVRAVLLYSCMPRTLHAVWHAITCQNNAGAVCMCSMSFEQTTDPWQMSCRHPLVRQHCCWPAAAQRQTCSWCQTCWLQEPPQQHKTARRATRLCCWQ